MVQYSELERKMDTQDHFEKGKNVMNGKNFTTSRIFSKLCKSVFLITLFCYLTSNTLAQETTSDTSSGHKTKSFPAQFSIYYPFATHGKQSTDYTYNFSLNLVYGKVGGVNGIEVSGLVGRVEGEINGVQIAGISNASGGVRGVQVAGLGNASDGVKGIQIAGFGNASDEVKGIQIGGFGNASDGVKGIQVAGFGNASDNVRGIQIGGFGNASDEVKGLQVAGFGNAADNVNGIQIGGFGNAADDVKGIQIGGIGNAADKITGLQIGIYNRIHNLRGLQIGIVSRNDTIEKGASLSLVNIVKRGFYREWELSFSDYANIALSYKMGMQRFYTIYTVGVNFIEDNLWNVGIGFGNRTPIGSRIDFRPELVSYNYLPMDFKNVQSTFTTHLKLGFVYNISEKLGLSLAPSVYVMNSSRKSDKEHYKVSPLGAFYTHEKNTTRTTMGIGVSLGLSLK